MKSKVLILAAGNQTSEIDWEKFGTVVTELSELYQAAKESVIDLILLEDPRTDLRHQVAVKLRRYNGLTDIWRVTAESINREELEEHFDGAFSRELGVGGIRSKIEQILHAKELLNRYGIIGRSAKMKMVAETIERIAPTDVPSLIVGPSGAGKELVAKAIHADSKRVKKAFVSINCGAIAEGLLESDLFGHEKGAFTGSISKREGLFQKANGGTIFLDEIGETKPELQVKLLRVLEDGTFYSVGSSEPLYTDVRIISATNRDLSEAIAEKKFRDDLYFRIGVVKIVLPPLYERKSDIQPLLSFFWRMEKLDYTDSALDLLVQYDWPGNIRQLKNFADRMKAFKQKGTVERSDVERFIDEQHKTVNNLPVSTGKSSEEAGQELIYHAILSLGNEIKLLRDLIISHLPSDNPDDLSADSPGALKGMTVEQMEKIMIRTALLESDGNRKEAAKKLGIGERTLYRKLSKYNLS